MDLDFPDSYHVATALRDLADQIEDGADITAFDQACWKPEDLVEEGDIAELDESHWKRSQNEFAVMMLAVSLDDPDDSAHVMTVEPESD